MPISRLLSQFDKGVELALDEHDRNTAPSSESAFSQKFAGFTFYDIKAAKDSLQVDNEDDPSPEDTGWARLDGIISEQPLLWAHLHKPLARLLREDEDLKNVYAGFATLFTVNRGPNVNAVPYSSMAIDVALDAPGFRDLVLSKVQFADNSTIPLTAVCLNTSDDPNFESVPIVFHWVSPDHNGSICHSATSNDLDSWAHVYVTAKIPRSDETGIETDLNKISFFGSDESPLIRVVSNSSGNGNRILDERQFYTRLRNHQARVTGKDPGEFHDADLAKMLAWTVTYFAYGCDEYRKRTTPDSCPVHHLAILCVPASYGRKASAALYLPVTCKPEQCDVSRAAHKALYLSRALGLPLERLKEFSAKYGEGAQNTYQTLFQSITHEFSKIEDRLNYSWLVPFTRLAQHVAESLHSFQQHFPGASTWRVDVAPELYRALVARRLLWIGKNFLGSSQMELGVGLDIPLSEAIARLLRSIAGSHVAVSNYLENLNVDDLIQPDWHRTIVESFQRSRDIAVSTIRNVADEIPSSYVWSLTEKSIPEALVFARLLSASVSNILEKALPISLFRVVVYGEPPVIAVTLENQCTNPGTEKLDGTGTKGVLQFLVRSVRGGVLQEFRFIQESQIWRTAYSVPAPFLRKNAP